MPASQIFTSRSLEDTEAIGVQIAKQIGFPSVVYLHGELGAGKTALCQAIVRAKGYVGAVTSPTYNLIQEYAISGGTIYHMDLYRVLDPSEIEFLGVADLLGPQSLFLTEWAERGESYLPPCSHEIIINKHQGKQDFVRNIELIVC